MRCSPRRRDHRCMTEILVAYASQRGSTAEIAEAIANKLRDFGLGAVRESVVRRTGSWRASGSRCSGAVTPRSGERGDEGALVLER